MPAQQINQTVDGRSPSLFGDLGAVTRHQLPTTVLLLERVRTEDGSGVVLSLDHGIIGRGVGCDGQVAVNAHFQVSQILTVRLVVLGVLHVRQHGGPGIPRATARAAREVTRQEPLKER